MGCKWERGGKVRREREKTHWHWEFVKQMECKCCAGCLNVTACWIANSFGEREDVLALGIRDTSGM